jgi:N-acetylneuraminic acid mutarotase
VSARARGLVDRTLSVLGATRAWWGARRKSEALRWKIVAPCPAPKHDAAGVQIGARLYVVAGYTSIETVTPFVEVLDLERRRWVERIPLADGVAHSHLAFASDGERFIYLVSGQFGPRCAPSVRDAFVLDVTTRAWRPLPPLPEPRYAAAMQLWRGRLHVMGGSLPDRYTPSDSHWSLGVAGGEPAEPSWREEPPIPRAVCHHAAAVVGDALYLLGGQAGDFVAIPGSPIFACEGRTRETYFPDVHRLGSPEAAWERRADMPVPVSHAEAAVVRIGSTLVLVGGQRFKDPQTFELELTDAIQAYDTEADRWRIVGRLPYRVKTAVAATDRGWLYAVGGQRDRGAADPRPGAVIDHAWRARLPISPKP